jgi:hypothetical protein
VHPGRVGLTQYGLGPDKKRTDIQRDGHVRTQAEDAVFKPRRENLEEINPTLGIG